MRWFDIDLQTFSVHVQGFEQKRLGHRTLYHSPGAGWVSDIADLRELEYAQVILVDPVARTVAFGRDYLGHYPLTCASLPDRLFVSDSYVAVHNAVHVHGGAPRVCEESVALYFTMGFVPHGRSLFKQILNCRATSYYLWQAAKLTCVDLFKPVSIRRGDSVQEIGEAIEQEVARCAAQSDKIDIWCSGGLDSSIMAMRFNTKGRRADLLTLSYGDAIHEAHGDGERHFVRAVARAANAPIRDVDLAPQRFEQLHDLFTAHHNGPVIDLPLPPKYALAAATRDMAITGEAGDTFFGGTKNALMAWAHHRQPHAPLGRLYAMAHGRFFGALGQIFRRGGEMASFAEAHCEQLVQSYPGDLQRKLFYLNTHEKLGSMIFAQSYFPSQVFGKRVRHPFAALSVYRTAFSVPDHRKFSYPFSKIALTELHEDQLPLLITRRKKSGTQLPLRLYLESLKRSKLDFSALGDTGIFDGQLMQRLSEPQSRAELPSSLLYAFVTLNLWLQKKEKCHAEFVSA
jgi:asparagine synthetase B (glutamine-hydrolysing)